MTRFVLAWMLLAACEQPAIAGSACAHASDCEAPLVCAVGRCRVGCTESRDCPALARCLSDPSSGVGVCSIASVDDCSAHDCALGFACRDGVCLNECDDGARCPDGTCAEGVCVPDGQPIGDAGVPADAGATITRVVPIEVDADDGEIDGALLPQGEPGATTFSGFGTSSPTRAFFRFTLPDALGPTAHLVDARLRVAGRGIWMTCLPADHLAVRADDASDARATTMATDFPGGATGAASTMAVVAWGPLSDWAIGENVSPDLSPLLAELVAAHGGLAAGAHVRLWLEALDFTHACEVSWSDSADPNARDPELVLTWTP